VIDPVQMLERAAAQLRGLEGMLTRSGGDGKGPFDAAVWRDLEEAAAAMSTVAARGAWGAGAPAGGARVLQPAPAPAPAAAPPKAPVAQFSGFPPVDMFVTEGRVVINAALPGVERPAELQVTLMGDTRLRLAGTLPPHPLAGRAGAALAEQVHGPFSRTIGLPVPVRPETARCFYHNGLLEIWLERRPEVERTVPVSG
jgi:HSP20 family molecular chaperone IbpA